MMETILNGAWFAVAAGVFFAAPRCTPRVRVALLCALALLFPIISASDDFNASASFSDAAALAIAVVIAILLIALARVHSVVEPAYAIALATPSDPRSPPR